MVFYFRGGENQSFVVQKMLTLVPLLFGCQTFLRGYRYTQCPFTHLSAREQAFVRLWLITVVTIAFTFIHSLFYLLSRGWKMTRQHATRGQTTNLTMIMGIVYLFYSAYFLSTELLGGGMTEIINFMLALLYMAFGVSNVKNINLQIGLVKHFIAE